MESLDKENVGASPSKKPKKKTVEETYQKLTQLEHVLLRPDTYIGSTEMNRTKVAAPSQAQGADCSISPGCDAVPHQLVKLTPSAILRSSFQVSDRVQQCPPCRSSGCTMTPSA